MSDLLLLREEIPKRLSGYRLRHVFSVADECEKLADIFKLSEKDHDRLAVAALLHDITKNGCDQQELAAKLGIELTADDREVPSILHSITGSVLAARDFPSVADDVVCHAIRVHTTGAPQMNLIDKLLFLADYIEPLRNYEGCRRLREFFYRGIDQLEPDELIVHLDRTLVTEFDQVIGHLIESGQKIHPLSVISRNFLLQTT